MRINSIVPNFEVDSTQGKINFYDWQGDSEILRVIDSMQLVDKIPQIATPANWVPGEKVMILPTVKDEELPKLFPKGVDKVSMPSGKVYVRTTTNY